MEAHLTLLGLAGVGTRAGGAFLFQSIIAARHCWEEQNRAHASTHRTRPLHGRLDTDTRRRSTVHLPPVHIAFWPPPKCNLDRWVVASFFFPPCIKRPHSPFLLFVPLLRITLSCPPSLSYLFDTSFTIPIPSTHIPLPNTTYPP